LTEERLMEKKAGGFGLGYAAPLDRLDYLLS